MNYMYIGRVVGLYFYASNCQIHPEAKVNFLYIII